MQFPRSGAKRLIVHESIHDDEYNEHMRYTEECRMCLARFGDTHKLGHHQVHVHGRLRPKTDYIFKCRGCPKCFKTSHGLCCHIDSGCLTGSNECSKCSQVFTTEYGLKDHSRNCVLSQHTHL